MTYQNIIVDISKYFSQYIWHIIIKKGTVQNYYYRLVISKGYAGGLHIQ